MQALFVPEGQYLLCPHPLVVQYAQQVASAKSALGPQETAKQASTTKKQAQKTPLIAPSARPELTVQAQSSQHPQDHATQDTTAFPSLLSRTRSQRRQAITHLPSLVEQPLEQ